VVADTALAALGAALIVFLGWFGAWDLSVAILVLVAAVAAVATRPVQAFRGRAELGLLRQPLRPDLRPHLLQFCNYALLAALILIAGALGTFTNLPFYAQLLGLPLSDRISGQQATVAVQLAALALVALALVPAPPGAARPQPRRPVLQCLPGRLPGTRPRLAEGCGGRRPAAGG
jgi:hypothetical protein